MDRRAPSSPDAGRPGLVRGLGRSLRTFGGRVLRRRRLVAGGVVILVVVVAVAATLRMFRYPDRGAPERADAVFVLDGGGDRVGRAIELVEAGVSARLVMASEFFPEWNTFTFPQCTGDSVVLGPEGLADVDCFEPDPATTRGEARALARYAAEEGWRSVVVVASTDQITRARMLIERCWDDGSLHMVGVDHDQAWPWRAAYEWAATANALVDRSC